MKKLTRDIKKMLNALAMEHAGDFLPMREKLDLLNTAQSSTRHGGDSLSPISAPESEVHVAILFDGQVSESLTDYVLHTSHIAHARLDILTHGSESGLVANAKRLSGIFQQEGRGVRIVPLSDNSAQAFIDYRRENPGLHLIVASDTDELVHEIIGNADYRTSNHHIPLVLIQNPRSAPTQGLPVARGNVN